MSGSGRSHGKWSDTFRPYSDRTRPSVRLFLKASRFLFGQRSIWTARDAAWEFHRSGTMIRRPKSGSTPPVPEGTLAVAQFAHPPDDERGRASFRLTFIKVRNQEPAAIASKPDGFGTIAAGEHWVAGAVQARPTDPPGTRQPLLAHRHPHRVRHTGLARQVRLRFPSVRHR